MESYRSADTVWETVLDLDALSAEEGETWMWKAPSYLDEGEGIPVDRVLLNLSPGGSDAKTVREFDLVALAFVKPEDGGFYVPNFKSRVCWRTRDELLVSTDWGEGSLTSSGYVRRCKSWLRGTPLEDAVELFESPADDVASGVIAGFDRCVWHEYTYRHMTFFTSAYSYRRCDTSVRATDASHAPFVDLPLPDHAKFQTFGDLAVIRPQKDFAAGGVDFPSGCVLSLPLDDLCADEWGACQVLFTPTARCRCVRDSAAK